MSRVDVGWVLETDHAGFMWEAPTRVRANNAVGPRHAKSAAGCPAVLDQEARYFVVRCPVDLRLTIVIDGTSGEAAVASAAGDLSSIRTKAIGELVKRVSAKEWRHPSRPIIQFVTPYVFIADEPVWISQLLPFAFRTAQTWPGLMIGGRFPIDVWPRPLMWAFEWHDLNQELVLNRGDPLFFVGFETTDPSRHVRLVEAELTSELREYMAGTKAVANYVNQTFSLFKTALTRRPAKLLKPKQR
jgi:hypothetical protein